MGGRKNGFWIAGRRQNFTGMSFFKPLRLTVRGPGGALLVRLLCWLLMIRDDGTDGTRVYTGAFTLDALLTSTPSCRSVSPWALAAARLDAPIAPSCVSP